MNDRAPFEDLYAEHAGRVYRFALRLAQNREEAEDLAAESLAEGFRQWSTYRGEAAPGTWLCAIVLNRWRMQCRKGRALTDQLHKAREMASTFRFEDLELAQAIASLPESLREAFLLVKGEGFTHAEAAKILSVPTGTVYFRVHVAVHRLRAELDPSSAVSMAKIEVTCDQEL